MSNRDVDLGSVIVDQITPLRPYIQEQQRFVQAETIRTLSTRNIKYRSHTDPDLNERRGFLLEELVKASPEYEGSQMTEEERAVADFILRTLQENSPFFNLPDLAFHVADDIWVKINNKSGSKYRIATIIGLVEVKHTGSTKETNAQLRHIIADLGFVVGIVNRCIILQRNKKQTLPAFEDIEWPAGVMSIEIDPSYRKIVYLAEKGTLGETPGWERRYSEFSGEEVTDIARTFWNRLVTIEKGDADAKTQQRGSEMTIHRSGSQPTHPKPAEELLEQALEEAMTQTSPTPARGPREHVTACTLCNPKEPVVYVDIRSGGKAPFRDKRHGRNKSFTYFGENCGGDFIVQLSEDIQEQINKAIDSTKEVLPDTNADHMKAEVERQANQIFEADGTLPRRWGAARDAYKQLEQRYLLLLSEPLNQAGLQLLNGLTTDRAVVVRKRIEDLEAKRKSMSDELADEERVSFYHAEPDDSVDPTVALLNHPQEIFKWALRFYHHAAEAKHQAENQTTEDEQRRRMVERRKQMTGKDTALPAPAAPVAEPAPVLVDGEQKICPHCQKVNKSTRTICGGCGQSLTVAEQPVVPTAIVRTCPLCGLEVEPEDRFCDNQHDLSVSTPPAAAPSSGQTAADLVSPEAVAAARDAGRQAQQPDQTPTPAITPPAASPAPAPDLAPTPPPAPATTPNQISFIGCPGCNATNIAGSKYCSNCQEELPQ